MASNVEILIIARDQASDVIRQAKAGVNDLAAATNGLGQQQVATSESTRGMGRSVSETTSLALLMGGAMGGLDPLMLRVTSGAALLSQTLTHGVNPALIGVTLAVAAVSFALRENKDEVAKSQLAYEDWAGAVANARQEFMKLKAIEGQLGETPKVDLTTPLGLSTLQAFDEQDKLLDSINKPGLLPSDLRLPMGAIDTSMEDFQNQGIANKAGYSGTLGQYNDSKLVQAQFDAANTKAKDAQTVKKTQEDAKKLQEELILLATKHAQEASALAVNYGEVRTQLQFAAAEETKRLKILQEEDNVLMLQIQHQKEYNDSVRAYNYSQSKLDPLTQSVNYLLATTKLSTQQAIDAASGANGQSKYTYAGPKAMGFHGDVNTPTMFMAGEAGKERVDIGGGGETHFHFGDINIGNGMSAEDVKQAIRETLGNAQKNANQLNSRGQRI